LVEVALQESTTLIMMTKGIDTRREILVEVKVSCGHVVASLRIKAFETSQVLVKPYKDEPAAAGNARNLGKIIVWNVLKHIRAKNFEPVPSSAFPRN